MLIAIAASEAINLEGADLSNAYLYGDLDIPIIIGQPTDSCQEPAKPGHACKFTMSIFGTKQAEEICISLLHKPLVDWGLSFRNLMSPSTSFKAPWASLYWLA